jgi:hypothetical protein
MGGCLRFFGLFVAAVVALVVLGVVFESALRVVLFLLLALGVWLVYVCGKELLARSGRPGLVVGQDVLKPGDTVAVTYGSARPIERVRLICRESTRRAAGNGREVTDTHDWVVEDVAGERQGELQMTIPTDAMHSFATRHHEIAWLVEASAEGGSVARADLTVLPAPYVP